MVEAIVGKTTTTLRWRSRCQAGDNGDHDDAVEMETKSTRWWWPYHVTYFDCMWCLSFMHLIFLSTTVALLDDPSLKFQGISVLPEYALLRQFFMPRHHVMIGCDKLYVHIQRVQASFCTWRILGLNLTSLTYGDMASEHWDRKVKRESYSRYDQHRDVHHLRLLPITWWSDMV